MLQIIHGKLMKKSTENRWKALKSQKSAETGRKWDAVILYWCEFEVFSV